MAPHPLSLARGTLAVLRDLPGQRRIPYLPAERVRELRDARVRALVTHAAATVPHYRDLFRREGIDPREIRTAEDLERLPLLDRATVVNDPARLRSEAPSVCGAVAYRTVGTTGEAVEVHHDPRSLLANIAFGERERAVEARFAGRAVRYSTLSISSPTGTGARTRAWYRTQAFVPVRPRHHHVPVLEPVDRVVAELDRLRPELVGGQGSHLELVFRQLAEQRRRFHRPKALVYRSDLMTPGGKAFIEHELGIPVLSRYNAVEAFKIGFTCEERRSFHLHEDLCHVTVRGPDGRQLRAGERGEVVISNLVNHATVLLNYRLGDLARIEPEPCGCGRTSRLLSALEGRTSEIVHFPDGSFVVPNAVWGVLRTRPEVIRYQLVQEGPDRFTISVVTAEQAAFERLAPGIAADLSRLLRGATVAPTWIALSEAGEARKSKQVVALPRPERGP